MKFYGSVVASCFLLLSAFGCKPKADSSVSGIAGGTPRKGNCSNVEDWLASPVTCQKDKDQIIVTEVFTKAERPLFSGFEHAEKKGFKICLGAIRYFNDKDQTENGWKTGYGVWLNGFSGLGGCHTGTDYRNVYSGAKGNNVVTPFLTKSESTQDKSLVTHQIFLPHKPTLPLGELTFIIHTNEFKERLYNFFLCSDRYDKRCELSLSEGTLKIKLDVNAKSL